MIIGFNTEKFGKNKIKYLITASYDFEISKFFTEELVVDIDKVSVSQPIVHLLTKCLNWFFYLIKRNPEYIIIYRSGSSDREKEVIMNTDVKSACNLLSGKSENGCYQQNYVPKMCFVVVNKRTESKFFEINNGNISNPKGGTVVDTIITQPDSFEFYLQPQFVNMGCATPTYFHCIYNSMNIPLEILEQISYNLCYYYWNWAGAIRIPAALKYAESACKFNSTNLKSEVKDCLKNSPYYI